MAIYHLSAKICGRGRGIGGSDQSPVAASAYQSGQKLYNEKDGEYKNYGRKERILAQGLILADNFPPDWTREKLWNEVEKSEKHKNAQLFRKWDMALPRELSRDENIDLAKNFIQENFVKIGMCADWAIHYDSKNQNPHLHIMTTLRKMDENHQWMPKKRKEYILKDGKKQYDKKTKTYKCHTIPTTNWDKIEFLRSIRKAWAQAENTALKKAGQKERVTEKSYKDLAGKNQLYHFLRPTKHRGQSLKYNNVEEMAHNEKVIRTYLRDACRTYYRCYARNHKTQVGVKIRQSCVSIKSAGFAPERLKKMFEEENEKIKSNIKKLGHDALKPEIIWDLLSEYEKQDLAYKQGRLDL